MLAMRPIKTQMMVETVKVTKYITDILAESLNKVSLQRQPFCAVHYSTCTSSRVQESV